MENTARKSFDLDGETFNKEVTRTVNSVLVDVRTPVEFYEGTITGAINIDYMSKKFDEEIRTLARDKTYFVFCRNGNRSLAACLAMEKQGLKVFNLRKGIRTRSL